MEKGTEQDALKARVKTILGAYQEASFASSKLDREKTRLFYTFVKGLVDRVGYW